MGSMLLVCSPLRILSRFSSLFVGFGSRTKFDVLVEKKERLLRKSVITYIGAASEFTGWSPFARLPRIPPHCSFAEPEITLILSPITITPKREDHASRFSGTTCVTIFGECSA